MLASTYAPTAAMISLRQASLRLPGSADVTSTVGFMEQTNGRNPGTQLPRGLYVKKIIIDLHENIICLMLLMFYGELMTFLQTQCYYQSNNTRFRNIKLHYNHASVF